MLEWLFGSLLFELRSLHNTLKELRKDMSHTQEVIDEIKAEVAEVRTVNQSARDLLDKLFELVEEHIDDPTELREVLTGLRADKEAMVASITKNTPSEEEPTM